MIEEGVDKLETAALLSVSVVLVAMMSVVGPALILGSIILLIDGSVANYQNDAIVMILVTALSLVALGASLRAFIRALKGGPSITVFHKYLTFVLPILWVVGLGLGYFASTSIIADHNKRAEEGAIYACEDVMEKSDLRWEKCLVAVPTCSAEANPCKKISSTEQGAECVKEFKRRRSALNASDQSKIADSGDRYKQELKKICLLEHVNE